jgi:hypothetical protein
MQFPTSSIGTPRNALIRVAPWFPQLTASPRSKSGMERGDEIGTD